VFIDEVNMFHKIRVRDDPRIDDTMFFEEQMTLVAHIKSDKPLPANKSKKDPNSTNRLKGIKDLADFKNQFDDGEFLVFKIFDKVKVLVETTTEFPLDI
jgi:hypothetical protein